MTTQDAARRLLSLSEKAMQGKWTHDWGKVICDAQIPGGCSGDLGQCLIADMRGVGYLRYGRTDEQVSEIMDANGDFIAAANPQAIADLCRSYLTLSAANEAMGKALGVIQAEANRTSLLVDDQLDHIALVAEKALEAADQGARDGEGK